MTLGSTTIKVTYNGDDSTIVFPVTFVFWLNADLRVILRDALGAETVWVEGTQYTLAGGNGAVGTLTVKTTPTDFTPATGETLTIKDAQPETQGDSLPLSGAFPSTVVEQRFDKITRLVQQHSEELTRTLQVPETDPAAPLVSLPDDRASKILAFNSAKQPIAVNPTDASSTAVTATGTSTARLLAERFANIHINVKSDYGAVLDGVTDDTAAINAAIVFGATTGAAVFIPPGTALVSDAGGGVALTMLSGVHLFGAGHGATTIKLANGADAHVINMTGVTDASVSNLTIDGNRANQTVGAGAHGLRADGTRLRFWNLDIVDAEHYCMGLGQAGSLMDVRLHNISIRNAGDDGIDMKNKNDDNYGVVLDGIFIDTFDLKAGGQNAGIDVRGEGVTLSNIHARNVSQAAGNIAIRFREGELLDANGLGGHNSSLTNFSIFGDAATNVLGIQSVSRNVNISNGYVADCGTAVQLLDSDNSVEHVACENCSIAGFDLKAQDATLTADDCSILNCRTDTCVIGFDLEAVDRCLVQGCRGQNNTTNDIRIQAGATDTGLFNNILRSTTTVGDGGTDTHARNNVGWVTEAILRGVTDHNLAATGTRNEAITHGLDVTPNIEHCQVNYDYKTGNKDAVISPGPYADVVNGTTITARMRVSTIDTVGPAVANFTVYINARP